MTVHPKEQQAHGESRGRGRRVLSPASSAVDVRNAFAPLGDDGLEGISRYDGLWNLYLDGAGISDEAWERYFALHPEVHVHVDQAHHDRDPNRHE